MEEKVMTKPSKDTLKRVANEWAGIDLSEAELVELERILGEISQLRELDIPEIEPVTIFVI